MLEVSFDMRPIVGARDPNEFVGRAREAVRADRTVRVDLLGCALTCCCKDAGLDRSELTEQMRSFEIGCGRHCMSAGANEETGPVVLNPLDLRPRSIFKNTKNAVRMCS